MRRGRRERAAEEEEGTFGSSSESDPWKERADADETTFPPPLGRGFAALMCLEEIARRHEVDFALLHLLRRVLCQRCIELRWEARAHAELQASVKRALVALRGPASRAVRFAIASPTSVRPQNPRWNRGSQKLRGVIVITH